MTLYSWFGVCNKTNNTMDDLKNINSQSNSQSNMMNNHSINIDNTLTKSEIWPIAKARDSKIYFNSAAKKKKNLTTKKQLKLT